jgi:hypothetical protein
MVATMQWPRGAQDPQTKALNGPLHCATHLGVVHLPPHCAQRVDIASAPLHCIPTPCSERRSDGAAGMTACWEQHIFMAAGMAQMPRKKPRNILTSIAKMPSVAAVSTHGTHSRSRPGARR